MSAPCHSTQRAAVVAVAAAVVVVDCVGAALAVEEAGAFSVVLECIPQDLAQKITDKLSIPTVGIGSGSVCDGQIQVFHDVVGFSKNPAPKHALKQTDTYSTMFKAVNTYKALVEK